MWRAEKKIVFVAFSPSTGKGEEIEKTEIEDINHSEL
jgi:hypothetical protein